MIARIKIEQPGLGVTAQDCGRTRYRALGVPLSGALDPLQLAAANALAGAPEGSAGLEILLAAPSSSRRDKVRCASALQARYLAC